MIKLKNYISSDAERLIELANNRKVSRYLVYTFPYPYTMKDAEWWIEEGSKQNNAVTKVIELDGEFIGSVGLVPQTGWREHCAEIGYWLGEQYWGKGIATEVVSAQTEEAFSKYGFRKLFAPVLAPNIGSQRVLQKCGYELEGVLRTEVQRYGVYYDTHHYTKYCF
jgi:[ribosomal protein S5]-alanine N-acetyltransferase